MLTINNDNECLEKLRNSQESALAYLIEIYFPVLRKYAYKIINNEAEAEDVITESFIKIWERREAFSTFSELKAFLYVTVKNTCLNLLRHHQREKVRHIYFHQEENTSSLDEFIYEEMLAEIRKSIAKLPIKMQKVFILSYFNKLTNEQIADYLNLSNQTVRNQKAKALKALREVFKNKKILWLLFLVHFT